MGGKIKVIGSSSKGNGYAIIVGDEILLLECGLLWRDALRACDYKSGNIVGCLVSHIHGDHSKYVMNYSDRVQIFSHKEVTECCRAGKGTILHSYTWYRVGEFKVMPLELEHDVTNYGYIIYHPEVGNIFFGTDTFAYKENFLGINHWLVEANYDDRLIENLDRAQKQRLLVSHMSIDYCIKYLEACHAEKSKSITLIHLSSRHSNAEGFLNRVERKFGVPTYIADKGTEIILN
jgi:ribonuclease BN (tRNA processing enzyme)